MVDAILRLGQVAVAVLGEVEVVIRPADRRLEVGDEEVDPAERLQLTGLAFANDDRAMRGDLGASGVEAGTAIGDQLYAGVQCRLRPGGKALARIVGDRIEAHVQRMALLGELHCGHERLLVL